MALLATVMGALVLVALAGALVPLASTEIAIAANHRRATQTFYAAEAALEWAVQELQAVGSWDGILGGSTWSRLWGPTLRPPVVGGGVLDLSGLTHELTRRGAGRDGAGRGLGWRLYGHGPLAAILPVDPSNGQLTVVVWVADDDGVDETDGDPDRDQNGVVMLHAAAFGPHRTQRAVQATLARWVAPGDGEAAGRPAPTPRVQVRSWRLVR